MKFMHSKKGIMFTIVSVLVCALIITTFFTYQSISLDSDVENTKLRIKGIDRYANDADSYVSGLVYMSGKETLDFTLSIMIGNNSFLQNYTKEFKSCMLTGNLTVPWNSAGQVRCPDKAYLAREFSSFEDFSNANLNIHSNITLIGIGIEQEEPWNIVVYANYTLLINDSYAFWNETRTARARISVTGLRDPTYAIINTSNHVNDELRPIRDTRHVINSTYVTIWNQLPSTAHSTVINGSYFEWWGAPSYIERLEGIKNASDIYNFSGTSGGSCSTGAGRCGIVSIIPVSQMDIYAVGHESIFNPSITRSSLDFEFWNNKPLLTQEQRYVYGRYDFWKTYYDYDALRMRMKIYSENASNGLNGSVIPDLLMSRINMSEAGYILALD